MFSNLIALQADKDGQLVVTAQKMVYKVLGNFEDEDLVFTYTSPVTYDYFVSQLRKAIGADNHSDLAEMVNHIYTYQWQQQITDAQRSALLALCCEVVPEDQYPNYTPTLLEK